MYPSYKRQMVTTLLLDLVSFVLPGNCMCLLCVCKCLFFILLHGMRIQTFWLALTTTQKKYIDISNFSNKTLGSEQNPFLLFCRPCDFSVLFEVWEPEKTIISSIGKSLFQDQKMEFEHLLFKREAEEGEDKEEKKEVGKLWKIYSHSHNSISIFHPQSIIKKVEHELEKDVNLVAEKTHMKPWWVKLTKRVKRVQRCSRVPSEFWAG